MRPGSSWCYASRCPRPLVLKSAFQVEDGVESAASGLAKIFRDLLARVDPAEAPALAWPAVCGTAVAHRTRVLDFAEGVLYVEVPDRGWKTQLMDLAPRYVAALAEILGPRVLRIQFLLPGENTGQQGR